MAADMPPATPPTMTRMRGVPVGILVAFFLPRGFWSCDLDLMVALCLIRFLLVVVIFVEDEWNCDGERDSVLLYCLFVIGRDVAGWPDEDDGATMTGVEVRL